jgi:hypothetical protein
MKTVYLSGGMEYAEDEGQSWRSEMQRWLERSFGHSVFNPNERSDKFLRDQLPETDFRILKQTNLTEYISLVEQLVRIDCEEIALRSDYVVCYYDQSAQRGAGTKGELTIAKYFGKPVYLVCGMPVMDIPGWVLACATKIFSSFEELKLHLTQTYQPLK